MAKRSVLRFCEGLPIRTLGAGETLLAEGGRANVLYVLIEGQVEILKGDFQINVVDEPGSIFGEISVLLDVPHMATVKTLTPCRVHTVEEASAFLQSQREISYQLARMLAQRLQGVTSYLVDLKSQFEDQKDHLGLVDEVLESLIHAQDEEFTPGSERDPDKTI